MAGCRGRRRPPGPRRGSAGSVGWCSRHVRTDAVRAPDLVNRNFRADRPDALWVTDLTYVPTRSGMAYVCFIVDAFSRRIVGWRVATRRGSSVVARQHTSRSAWFSSCQISRPPQCATGLPRPKSRNWRNRDRRLVALPMYTTEHSLTHLEDSTDPVTAGSLCLKRPPPLTCRKRGPSTGSANTTYTPRPAVTAFVSRLSNGRKPLKPQVRSLSTSNIGRSDQPADWSDSKIPLP